MANFIYYILQQNIKIKQQQEQKTKKIQKKNTISTKKHRYYVFSEFSIKFFVFLYRCDLKIDNEITKKKKNKKIE